MQSGGAVFGSVVGTLVVHALFGWAGLAVAKRKNRSQEGWFAVCFIFSWIGLIILACLPRRLPPSDAVQEPVYDQRKWEALLAEPEVAVATARLRAYGEQYVTA